MLSYFSWNTRIGRLRYIARISGVHLVALLFSFLAAVFIDLTMMRPLAIVIPIILTNVCFHAIFGVQRLHDLNRSSWWIIFGIVPIINILFYICMSSFPGLDDKNNYGIAPPENSIGVHILASIFLPIFLIGYNLRIILLHL